LKLIEQENKMKTFSYHLEAIIATFKTLIKGRFLVFFVPGLAIMLLFLTIFSLGSTYNEFTEKASDVSYIGGFLGWLFGGIGSIFSTILNEIQKFFILVLLSPVMSILSENYDAYLTGQKYKFDVLKLFNDVLRAVFVVFIALILEMSAYLLFFVFSFLVPDAIEPVCYFLITAFFVGFSFYDYSLERYSVGTFGSLGFSFTKMLTMVLTGSIFSLIFMVPYIGIPVAPVLTVMISTVVYIKIRGIKVYEDGYVEPTAETQSELPNEDQKTLEN
jgi:CysZ protein